MSCLVFVDFKSGAMKLLLFIVLCTVAFAKTVDNSANSGRKLIVPDDPDDLLARVRQTKPKSRNTISGKISNGNTAANGQFPWVLRLTIVDDPFDTFICTGNIISSNFVLTVRHCFDPTITVSVIAEAGDVDRLTGHHVTRFSDFWWFAPVINPGNFNPDLAIVRLSAHYTFNDRINSIRLPALSQENFEWPGQSSQIVGWGRDASGDMPRLLQYGDFRMETNCWSQRRPTHLCCVAQNISVETRGKIISYDIYWSLNVSIYSYPYLSISYLHDKVEILEVLGSSLKVVYRL